MITPLHLYCCFFSSHPNNFLSYSSHRYAGRAKYGARAHSYRRVWRVDATYIQQQKDIATAKKQGDGGLVNSQAALNASSRPGDQGPIKQEWAGEIVKMGMRKEDNALVALRERVSGSQTGNRVFRTEISALKVCEEAARERDELALEELNKARYYDTCVYYCIYTTFLLSKTKSQSHTTPLCSHSPTHTHAYIYLKK